MTVDLHCHPNKLGGPHFPELDPDVGIAIDLFGLGHLTAIPTHKEFALVPAGLLSRGYSASDDEKIVGGNFIRVFREVTETRG